MLGIMRSITYSSFPSNENVLKAFCPVLFYTPSLDLRSLRPHRPDDMLVLGLTALRPHAAGRPAVRMDQGVTASGDDDAELLKRMAQQRLLGKTETQVCAAPAGRRLPCRCTRAARVQLLTCAALLFAVHLAAPRRLPQILEEMVKSEMGLEMVRVRVRVRVS